MTNTLAYYDMELIKGAVSFMVHAEGQLYLFLSSLLMKKARALVPGDTLQSPLMFVSKDGAHPSGVCTPGS